MEENANDDEVTVNVNWHVNPAVVNPRLETARSLTLAIIDQGDVIGPLWTGTWEQFITDAERTDKDGAWSAVHDLTMALALAVSSLALALGHRDPEDSRHIVNVAFDVMGRPGQSDPGGIA